MVASQDKIHLPNYGGYNEGDRFDPGTDLQTLEIGGFKITTLICEDAWHGSLAYLARLRGADIILHPAASTESAIDSNFDSEDAWTTICRAEAIYYGTYVLFVNQAGTDERDAFWGGSKLVAPSRPILEQATRGEQLVIVNVAPDMITEHRELLPMIDLEDWSLVGRELASGLAQQPPHVVRTQSKAARGV